MITLYLATITISICAWAMLSDIKTRLIPNKINLVGMLLVSITLGYGYFQGLDITAYLWSGLVSFPLILILFYTRILGGGDTKLLIVLGFSVPLVQLLNLWLAIALCGGLLALYYLLRYRNIQKTLPYGVAIFGGVILFWGMIILKTLNV